MWNDGRGAGVIKFSKFERKRYYFALQNSKPLKTLFKKGFRCETHIFIEVEIIQKQIY